MRKADFRGYRKMRHLEIVDPEASYEADFQDGTETCLNGGREVM